MPVNQYISQQLADRQETLKQIHEIIITADKNVQVAIETMMRNEMIVYKSGGVFKYGISSVKNYMSLHLMPIYASPDLYAKYKNLLPLASFQKGCINFKDTNEMPLDIVKNLMADCAEIDLVAIREMYLKSKRK